ncbi:unnamed protein product [Prorocentrum cordatum]|uniref:Uncharacterized protein n=1 Tax=Prorocentrum cordatum TaxID=2364126 RepID=A0ABN9SS67_9DINO|nr:unnamed protein product [Polarella glacialis]
MQLQAGSAWASKGDCCLTCTLVVDSILTCESAASEGGRGPSRKAAGLLRSPRAFREVFGVFLEGWEAFPEGPGDLRAFREGPPLLAAPPCARRQARVLASLTGTLSCRGLASFACALHLHPGAQGPCLLDLHLARVSPPELAL